jgi:site-specific recombinase XerD
VNLPEVARMKEITFSQAIDGYLLYANSRRLSEHTVADYRCTFRRLQEFLEPDDPPMNEITLDVIEAFFAELTGLSKKTVVDYHTGLSALWTWAVKRRVADEHVVRQFDPPQPGRPMIEVFTEEELQKLLDACNRTKSYSRPGKRKCSNERPTALRNKAIILTLLDSLARVSELCGMRRSETNLKEGRIKVLGKGDKERWVPISTETAQVIWQYLAVRPATKPRYLD